MHPHDLAQMIDHTLLKADATTAQIETLCKEARDHIFKTVCVNPTHITLCKKLLEGCSVGVCTVVGFPLGAMSSKAKAFEATDAINSGATEIDMVINIGALKDKNDTVVYNDIKEVAQACGKVPLKVILETSLLTHDEIQRACELSVKAGASFVKTSTGFSTGGATIENVSLMREIVGPAIGVKASGGVRTLTEALAVIKAGATRIGASASVAIVSGSRHISENNY